MRSCRFGGETRVRVQSVYETSKQRSKIDFCWQDDVVNGFYFLKQSVPALSCQKELVPFRVPKINSFFRLVSAKKESVFPQSFLSFLRSAETIFYFGFHEN